MQKPFTRVGKQIMASGTHYADAADETAAQFTLDALNTKAFAVTEDLLAALQGAIGALEQDLDAGKDSGDADWEGLAYQRLEAARAAIAKATGAGA